MICQDASSEYYPGIIENVYAPKWYFIKDVKDDDYSAKIVFSKKWDKTFYFIRHLIDLVNELEKEKIAYFKDYDLITIIPSHEPDLYSPTLNHLAKFLSDAYKIKYEKIILRIKNTRLDESRPKETYLRYEHVKDSMKISRELNEKKIILFDDVKTSGIEILEAKKILQESGVLETLTICLGINSAIDREDENMIRYDEGRRWVKIN